jgi:hypothetical protein
MAFAPFIAPLLAQGIGGFLGGPLGSGLLTAALTALETKDMKQGAMAGLMGGGIGGLLGGAGGAAGQAAAATPTMAATPTAQLGIENILSQPGFAGGAGFNMPAQAIPEGLWGGEGIRAALGQPAAQAAALPAAEFSAQGLTPSLGQVPSATIPQQALAGSKSIFDGGSFTDNLKGGFSNLQNAYNTPGEMAKLLKGPGMMAGIGYLGLQSAMEQAAAEEARKKRSGDRPSVYNTYGYRSAFAQGGLAQMDPGTMAGRYLRGKTDGVADQVPATINGQQPAALSDGEFVVDAHTVAALGNGNSEAGAAQLQAMQARVRKAKYGTPKMPKQIKPTKMLPA